MEVYHVFHCAGFQKYAYQGEIAVDEVTAKNQDALLFVAVQTYGNGEKGILVQDRKTIRNPGKDTPNFSFGANCREDIYLLSAKAA